MHMYTEFDSWLAGILESAFTAAINEREVNIQTDDINSLGRE